MATLATPKEAFAHLRPACVGLTRTPTVESVGRLEARLRAVGGAALQELQEYVLFPLRFTLKTPGPKREGLVRRTVECLTSVLSATRVREPALLTELLAELCLCLAPRAPRRPAAASEELQLAVAAALGALVRSAEGRAALALVRPPARPHLGFAVWLLLGLAEREGPGAVRAAALDALPALLLQGDCPGHPRGPAEREEAAAASAAFLPGVASALARIVAGDPRQGHAVVVGALRAFSRTVAAAMADGRAEGPPPGAAERLAVLAERIAAAAAPHPHWRVRAELADLAGRLLGACRRSLEAAAGPLLGALAALAADEHPDVRARGLAALPAEAAPTDGLWTGLHGLAAALPRLLGSGDDRRERAALLRLVGYLRLLGPGLPAFLRSGPHLRRLASALVQAVDPAPAGPAGVEEEGEGGAGGGGRGAAGAAPLLLLACRLVGRGGDLYLLADHFTDLYVRTPALRTQAAAVLNQLVAGAAGLGLDPPDRAAGGAAPEELRDVAASVLEEYTARDRWWPDAAGGGARAAAAAVRQLRVQLEGVGLLAEALGPGFRPLLPRALYPLLEKAGDRAGPVRRAAGAALEAVGRACGYASARELVGRNADYLADGVALGLRRGVGGAGVLAALLGTAGPEALPLLDEVAAAALRGLERSPLDRAALDALDALDALLRALGRAGGRGPGGRARRGVTEAGEGEDGGGRRAGTTPPPPVATGCPFSVVARWFPEEEEAEPGAGAGPPAPPTPTAEEIERFVLDYLREKDVAEGLVPDSPGEGEEAPPPAEGERGDGRRDGETPLPPQIRIAEDVMERCVHLLSDPDLPVRLKVLDVLRNCVVVLRCHDRLLLPLVHRAWPPLVRRLTDDDPLAVLGAFEALRTLGRHCGDFLRNRFSKDVLPKLTDSLVARAPVSGRAGPVYPRTLAFKIQLALLLGLGPLCVKLDLDERDLNRVAASCLTYLSARQPVKLQEAAKSVFRQLMRADPDATWLVLNDVHCPADYRPPDPRLRPVALRGRGLPRDACAANVAQLLGELR
ncbi:TELO2-interacting protein 1 homolog [Ornithorhynchus anatinus]|uniref:TELO2-interacting protein 1 homolog n=1 Tax=Ornithorhynchus anatinus TaxID=9258 RepID=UPI0019D4A409|nr:TELO2-interacting protein 1 homolog [Ornithorhynchus anatinus]